MVRDALGRPLALGDVIVLDAPSAPWRIQEIIRVVPNPVNGIPDPRKPAELELVVSATLRIRALDERPLREAVRAATAAEVHDEDERPDETPGPRLVQPS